MQEVEFRKILREFESDAKALMEAHYSEYLRVLAKFLFFIDNTPVLKERILIAGKCEMDLEEAFKKAFSSSYQNAQSCRFQIGITQEEEIKNVYSILHYILDNEIDIGLCFIYNLTSSSKFQDCVNGFNELVVKHFINDIRAFLENEADKMGLIGQGNLYYIQNNGNNNAVAFGEDNVSAIVANNQNDEVEEFISLLKELRQNCSSLSEEEKSGLFKVVDCIQEEVQKKEKNINFWNVTKSFLSNFKKCLELTNLLERVILLGDKIMDL